MRYACPETHRRCKEDCKDLCAIRMGTCPHPDTLEGAIEEVRKSWRELLAELRRALPTQLLESCLPLLYLLAFVVGVLLPFAWVWR